VDSEPFVRAALAAIDEAGDPTHVRSIVEGALVEAAPLRRLARPAGAKPRVGWAARQLAMAADQPARAYARLQELVAALFEPVAGTARPPAPAPEVAAAATPGALLDALAPPPRVLSREVALAAKLDPDALLAEPTLARRVLGVRAIPQAMIGRHAAVLAELIAGPDPLAAEALAICRPAAASLRGKLASPLTDRLDDADGATRARALAALHGLELPIDDARIAAALHDPVADVRIAAAHTINRDPVAETVEIALTSRLADDDEGVRTAALGAVIRYPALHGPALVEALRAIVRRGDSSAREAIYLLGKLGSIARDAAIDIALGLASTSNPHQAGEALARITRGSAIDQAIVEALRGALTGPRSDAARTAMVMLQTLGIPFDEPAVEQRLARATAELAGPDRMWRRSGLYEAQRLGAAAVALIPAIRDLGERLAAVASIDAREDLRLVREVLTELGVADDDLPRPPSRLEAYRGIAPRELQIHGAYAVGSISESAGHGAVPVSSLGLWDHGTGKRLFVIERAQVLAFVPKRAEIAVVRTAVRPDARHGGTGRADLAWWFERYAVPSGDRVASIEIAAPLTAGWPVKISIAGGLATVWCADESGPYRFHVTLGDPDQVIDEAPVAGKPTSSRERTRTGR